MPGQPLLYSETQNNKYLLIVFAVVCALFGGLSVAQYGFHQHPDNHSGNHWAPLIALIIGIAGILFFSAQKLRTQITSEQITVNFGLLTSEKVIFLKDIKTIRVRRYDALKEYWGWGVRFNNNGTCYTVYGSNALEIELLHSNEKILIGTQKPQELKLLLAKLSINSNASPVGI